MINHNQDGAVNPLLVSLITAVVLLLGTLGFGFWAFAERQDYKNNSDEKVVAAVAEARADEAATKDRQYAEAAKLPNKTYTSPDEYGRVVVTYPKTWSLYNNTSPGEDLDLYFNPDVVAAIGGEGNTFALRLQVLDQAYDEVVSNYEDAEGVSIEPYSLPKVPSVVGMRVSGQIEDEKQGVMVILPVRDKTLQVFTESDSFRGDFDNTILTNLTFSP